MKRAITSLDVIKNRILWEKQWWSQIATTSKNSGFPKHFPMPAK
jgi:hypothetical protein